MESNSTMNQLFSNQHFSLFGRDWKASDIRSSPFWDSYWALTNFYSFGSMEIAQQEIEHTLVETQTKLQHCLQACFNTLNTAQTTAEGHTDTPPLDHLLETIIRSTQKELVELWTDHTCRMWTLPLRLGQSAEGQKRFPVTLDGEWQSDG